MSSVLSHLFRLSIARLGLLLVSGDNRKSLEAASIGVHTRDSASQSSRTLSVSGRQSFSNTPDLYHLTLRLRGLKSWTIKLLSIRRIFCMSAVARTDQPKIEDQSEVRRRISLWTGDIWLAEQHLERARLGLGDRGAVDHRYVDQMMLAILSWGRIYGRGDAGRGFSSNKAASEKLGEIEKRITEQVPKFLWPTNNHGSEFELWDLAQVKQDLRARRNGLIAHTDGAELIVHGPNAHTVPTHTAVRGIQIPQFKLLCTSFREAAYEIINEL